MSAEDYSSGSFLEESQSPQFMDKDEEPDKVVGRTSYDGETTKDQFYSALENFPEVSNLEEIEGEGSGRGEHVASGMSTIEEESKSNYSASIPSVSRRRIVEEKPDCVPDSKRLDISAELQELRNFVSETEAGLNEDIFKSVPSLSRVDPTPLPSTYDSDVDQIMKRLEEMQNTQDILEQVINTDVTVDPDKLTELICQIPLADTPMRNILKTQDHSERSDTAEIASIQKIIDAGDKLELMDANSQCSEVAGGNNLLSAGNNESPPNSRAVDDVLREYEELERSVSRASIIDESFRSDISSCPPLSTYSNKPEPPPVIKPPVFKSVVPPPLTKSSLPLPVKESGESMYSHHNSNRKSESRPRTKPMPSGVKVNDKSQTARMGSSLETKSVHQNVSYSARPSTETASARNNTQDAFKPRNRRMRSPRTVVSPRHREPSTTRPKNTVENTAMMTGAGEMSYPAAPYPTQEQHPARKSSDKNDYAVTEALKTIQKLSKMVENQETLLEAYSKDNEKLWTKLKEANAESQEKETNFQEVINSLRTEVATMRLSRLVTSSSTNPTPKASRNTQTQGAEPPPVYAKQKELENLRIESELKTKQLLELRKEVLVLQSKLKEQSKPVPKSSAQMSSEILPEKEKDYQKEVNALKKQVRTLQKILYSKDVPGPPGSQVQTLADGSDVRKLMQRTKSDITRQNVLQQNLKNVRNMGVQKPSFPPQGVNIKTADIIQASFNCMDDERHEFEKIIDEKNRTISEKEKMILKLKTDVDNLKGQLPDGDVVEPGLIDELRSRIITQNKAIHALKEHLSSFKKLEAENLILREDKRLLAQQVQELRRKLDFTQHLVKPENEVLCLLSEKVDELNSRYYHRERQLDSLLNKLTLKTTTGGGCGGPISSSNSNSSGSIDTRLITTNLSPKRIQLDQFTDNNGSLGGALLSVGKARNSTALTAADVLHMVDFSPTSSFQMYNSVPDLPDM